MEAEPDVVESSLLAVLPSVALRGSVLAAIFAGFAYLYLFHFWGWTRSVLGPVAELRVALTLGASAAVVLVVLGVAGLAYSRRRYEFGQNEVVEHRGVLRTRTTVLPYEEISDVHLLQSPLQRAFGVGTVRVNEQDASETGQSEALRLRFVERPDAVYDRLRDDTGRSFETPRETVEPDPTEAAWTSAFRGIVVGVVAGFVPVVLLASILEGWGLSTGQGLLAGVTLVAFAVLARSVQVYSGYDGRRYDVYQDRVEDLRGASTTAVGFDDVHDVVVYESLGRLGLAEGGRSLRDAEQSGSTPSGKGDDSPGPPDRDSRGRVDLTDADGGTLVSLRYVSGVERLGHRLASLVEFDTQGSRSEGTDGEDA